MNEQAPENKGTLRRIVVCLVLLFVLYKVGVWFLKFGWPRLMQML